MMEEVVLVDQNDVEVGSMEKLQAHETGQLHRAFSVLLFNKKGEMLLQKRAFSKYHCGGLWTNACCSHPRPGEQLESAVHRRMQEELNIDLPGSEKIFDFIYNAPLENGLIEHEFDHVFMAQWNEIPDWNPDEVEAMKFASIPEIKSLLQLHPQAFTPWFKIIFAEFLERNSSS